MILPSINLSVFKREDIDFEEVERQLTDAGWEKTGSIRESVFYYEKSGFNITVVDGPQAVSAFPSGPIRGRMFSNVVGNRQADSAFGINFNNTPELKKDGEGVPASMQSNTSNTLNV